MFEVRLKIPATIAVALSLVLAAPDPGCFSSEKPVAYFGVNLRFDPIEMYERYQPMMDYLTRTTSYQFHLKISHNYAEGVRHLTEGKTQIASLGDGAVIGAIQKHGAIPIVKPLNQDGRPLYRCFFIIPSKSGIRSLRELKGKTVALGYYHSITGNLIPRQMMNSYGIGKGELASLSNLANHTTVAKAVLKGEYQAGAVKDVVAIRWVPRGLRILAASEELPSTPIVARHDAPPRLIREVTRALVKLDRLSPKDRKILEHWDEEYKNGFVAASADDYRNVGRLYSSTPFGCATGCHR